MIDLTKENFEEEVLKAQGYVLVDFYGDGCVPCAALMPHIHKFEEVYGTTVKFCSLNTTKARRLAIAQKVLGLPRRPHRRRCHIQPEAGRRERLVNRAEPARGYQALSWTLSRRRNLLTQSV